MKILVDAETEAILGASILGVGGDEAIHCLLGQKLHRRPHHVEVDARCRIEFGMHVFLPSLGGAASLPLDTRRDERDRRSQAGSARPRTKGGGSALR
jgi:hypothetical protein